MVVNCTRAVSASSIELVSFAAGQTKTANLIGRFYDPAIALRLNGLTIKRFNSAFYCEQKRLAATV